MRFHICDPLFPGLEVKEIENIIFIKQQYKESKKEIKTHVCLSTTRELTLEEREAIIQVSHGSLYWTLEKTKRS